MLVEHNQVIEHAHHRSEHHNRRLLVDRHAGDASTERHSEDTARLLRQGRVARPWTPERPARYQQAQELCLHLSPPFTARRITRALSRAYLRRARAYLSSQRLAGAP